MVDIDDTNEVSALRRKVAEIEQETCAEVALEIRAPLLGVRVSPEGSMRLRGRLGLSAIVGETDNGLSNEVF